MECYNCGEKDLKEIDYFRYEPEYWNYPTILRLEGNRGSYSFCVTCGRNFYRKYIWHCRKFMKAINKNLGNVEDLYNISLQCERCGKTDSPLTTTTLWQDRRCYLCSSCYDSFKDLLDILCKKFHNHH